MEDRHYKINIEPRILELLGPSLYTNIYYILGELIANAYDADANNVYIIETQNSIIVEDDGVGMSYSDGDTENFLDVAKESRVSEAEALTPLKRRKMGRKGVGKLASLSVSENVKVKTIKNGEKSGFVLSRNVVGKELEAIQEKDITFERVVDHGTAIEMVNPTYSLPKRAITVRDNIVKIFPLVDNDFVIHIILQNDKELEVSESQSILIKKLGSLITYGNDFSSLKNFFDQSLLQQNSKLCKSENEILLPVKLKDKKGNDKILNLHIHGWIGVYKTTANNKAELKSFADNFLAIYANKKMGEFNILSAVGKNKLNEVYVVGQLHIDEFENSDFPDMALSNRQGYKDDDPRYVAVISYVRENMLPEILRLRNLFSQTQKDKKKSKKLEREKNDERQLKKNVEIFGIKTAESISKKIEGKSSLGKDSLNKIINETINENFGQLQLKSKVDSQKKKVLISHTGIDKNLADVVYDMLLFNGFDKSEILYTSSDDIEARIPTNSDIFDYLREFFVESISNQKIFVIYITSDNMNSKWAVLSEVGAGWITKVGHYILTLNDFLPQKPLDTGRQFQSTLFDGDNLYANKLNIQLFCDMIKEVCINFKYEPKSKEDNIQKIKGYISELTDKDYSDKRQTINQKLKENIHEK